MRSLTLKKIPATIGMLTLNSAEGLRACLESVKDFAEIIVCDGNSTDGTEEIAREFGAKVIPQYDTDATELRCVMDKANVRQKNMDAASNDWYFFMDSDDTLSFEAIEEIRKIVSDPHPEHLVYRMPTRIFMAGKEILHEATYPSYQTRLVNRKAAPRFRGRVHDRIVVDEKKFPVGTMSSYYNFHWSEDRVRNFWPYLRRYADWELITTERPSLHSYLYWGLYRRLRTIAGYLLYRLPSMYLRHGFKDSMPLPIELTIVRYHFRILFGDLRKYISTRTWAVILRETLRGKDINRTLSNLAVGDKECFGKVLDIGGAGGNASYFRFLKQYRWMQLTTVDINPAAKPDVVLNMENEPLPFAPETFDSVLAFNILEHISKREKVLGEVHAALRPGGELVGVIPFLVNVHPDPFDFVRLTRQGLDGIFRAVGFKQIEIMPVGRGPFLAGYYQFEFVLPRLLRLLLLPLVFALDGLLALVTRGTKLPLPERFPLSYVFYAKK
jgi:glycosyltransferase involved in cell wall biosynthesis